LCEVLNAWYREQGLEPQCAEEKLQDPSLTDSQRVWLTVFCILWDHTIDPESKSLDVWRMSMINEERAYRK
jgi:hypothetical protein